MERPKDFDALPKRHRDYIIALENRANELQAQLPKIDPTTTSVMTYGRNGEQNQWLDDNATIKFTFSEYSAIQVKRKHGALEIYGAPRGLVVYPSVSNVIYVELKHD